MGTDHVLDYLEKFTKSMDDNKQSVTAVVEKLDESMNDNKRGVNIMTAVLLNKCLEPIRFPFVFYTFKPFVQPLVRKWQQQRRRRKNKAKKSQSQQQQRKDDGKFGDDTAELVLGGERSIIERR